MAAAPLLHSMSMAELVTRAQPCDAGWAGMLPEPWMAMPPVKYLGRYRVPSGASRTPSTSRWTANCPVGVRAMPVPPDGES
jgi:hypothetical protein